jgi:hypothetical protein
LVIHGHPAFSSSSSSSSSFRFGDLSERLCTIAGIHQFVSYGRVKKDRIYSGIDELVTWLLEMAAGF